MSRPVGPYSPVVRSGGWLVTSGQLGTLAGATGPELVGGGTAEQLRQALTNLAAVLASEGASLADVVTATLYLVRMEDFADANRVWVEAFGDHRPARSAVGVASLPLGALVEVAAWAAAPSG
jgi:2-iminobutanoate/2-iminopropanoate deaminase